MITAAIIYALVSIVVGLIFSSDMTLNLKEKIVIFLIFSIGWPLLVVAGLLYLGFVLLCTVSGRRD